MTCEEARELIGGDPDTVSPELLAHLESCRECRAYREEILALNAKIRRALELDLGAAAAAAAAPAGTQPPVAAQPAARTEPAPRTQPVAGITPSAANPPAADRSNVTTLRRSTPVPTPTPRHRRPRLFAFAASVAAAMVVALTLWLSRPAESLATEVAKHVDGEPDSWHMTEPVSNSEIIGVLRRSGVKLGPGMPSIVYASSCWFRGHFVPHLVVTTQDGPVTVMILQHEKVSASQQFHEEGYTGLLVPAPAGSVAVLSRTPMSLEQPASDVLKALQSAHQPAQPGARSPSAT
jgi:hypothetical protein